MLSDIVTVVLTRGENGLFGFYDKITEIVGDGPRIIKIIKGGQAEKDGLIHVGDEILEINQKEFTEIDDIGSVIQNSGPFITLTVRKAGNI